MPRTLVLGGTGMLGHKVFQVLRGRFPDTVCTVRDRTHPAYQGVELLGGDDVIGDVDLTDFPRVASVLQRFRPDVIVNCSGMIKHREQGADPVPNIWLNSLFPHWLAEAAARTDSRVIHFSTDCVFSGTRGLYTEDDISDASDIYGRTKHLGEIAGEDNLTLRTSIIGRELAHFTSLLEWFLAQDGTTVTGFRGAIYSGLTTLRLAQVVADIVAGPFLSGLFHVASEPVSKYDLLCMVRDQYGLDIEVVPDDDFRCDRSLDASRLESALGLTPPTWRDLVAELAADPTPYERWR